MNDPRIVRQKVRWVLSTYTERPLSEGVILSQLNGLQELPETVTVPELKTALEWNHARELVDYRRNEDTELIEWSLTKAGKLREGLQ